MLNKLLEKPTGETAEEDIAKSDSNNLFEKLWRKSPVRAPRRKISKLKSLKRKQVFKELIRKVVHKNDVKAEDKGSQLNLGILDFSRMPMKILLIKPL